jgi:hypothetical protein
MQISRITQASGWRSKLTMGVLLCPLLVSLGCQTATGTGAAAGGAIGAGVGGLLSRCPGGALAGAAIGAGAGALGGAAVDASRERKAERAAAADVAVRTLSLPDVVNLTQSGMDPGVIIQQIRTSGAVYRLTADDLTYLNREGVSSSVIQELQATAYRAPRRVVYPAEPVYVAPPVVVPSVGVGIGFGR